MPTAGSSRHAPPPRAAAADPLLHAEAGMPAAPAAAAGMSGKTKVALWVASIVLVVSC